jgi:hypothetical protein
MPRRPRGDGGGRGADHRGGEPRWQRIVDHLLDPDAIYFPDRLAIAPLAIPFARLMLAHAKFEGEFRSLQGAITNDPNFGERRANQ